MKSYEIMSPKTIATLSETTGVETERAIMQAVSKKKLPKCLFNFVKGKMVK